VGDCVGSGVGLPATYVGDSVGSLDGFELGSVEGSVVGGGVVGDNVGLTDGARVGLSEGSGVGLPAIYVGLAEGTRVGLLDGRELGHGVG